MKKRIFGILLTLCMVLALFPTTVFAKNDCSYSVSGVENGKTYCGPQTVTIACEGEGLSELKINGTDALKGSEALTFQFTLDPMDEPQTIYFKQIRNRNPATITVTINDGHTPGTDNPCMCEVCGAATHDLTHHDAVDATTEKDGNIEYWQCENCEECFSDEKGENEISLESTVIPKLYSFTVGFSVNVQLGGNTAPGETTFTVVPINDDKSITVTGGTVTVNGAGTGTGTLTFTGSMLDLLRYFAEGAYFQQRNDGQANWVYDDTRWALYLVQNGGDDNGDNGDNADTPYSMVIYPVTEDENGAVSQMTFTNTYTLHSHNYNQKFNNTHHWDECDCNDVQNKALHSFGDWNVITAPTETTEGTQTRACTLCDYVEEEVIPKLTPATPTPSPEHSHTYVMDYDKTQHWNICDCGDVQLKEDHKFGAWTVTKKATETATGEKVRACSVCGYSETAEVPKLTKPESPDTGDYFNSLLWLGLFAVSAAGVAGCGLYRRKRS